MSKFGRSVFTIQKRQPRLRSVTSIAAIILVVTACGSGSGDDEAKIKTAARSLLTEEMQGDVEGLDLLSPWINVTTPAVSFTDLAIQRPDKDQKRATLRATAKITIHVTATSQAAPLIRILPPGGVDISTTRKALVDLANVNDRWIPIEQTVQVSRMSSESLTQGVIAQATQFAARAISTLLTFNGNAADYQESQEQYYATHSGESIIIPVDSSIVKERRLDVPPHLGEYSKSDPSNRDRGTVWARRRLGEPDPLGIDDPQVPLIGIFDDSDLKYDDCDNFDLKHMSVSPLTPTYVFSKHHDFSESVVVEGFANVVAGQWNGCNGGFLEAGKDYIRSASRKVPYSIHVARLGSQGDSWFVAELSIGRNDSVLSSDYQPNLYDSTSSSGIDR